ncbi:histidine--tRNA ligase [Candidatus Saccharibacteria bacterium]|nr:histidine--tRNA ligase [Candidatus Saccharibacteria bacterium]
MQKVDTKPLSGFIELLPEWQAEFDRIRGEILAMHHAYGFISIDTPLIYRRDLLLAKAGGDTEKQIYELEKGDTKLALRFDQTVPLAIYVANNSSHLAFPFKVSQIGRSYRGERAQRGRQREFYQCDADVIGRGELPVAYDAEIISLFHDIFTKLKFGDFTIRVSNRRLMTGFLESLNLKEEQLQKTISIVDHAEKITGEEFRTQLLANGVDEDLIWKLMDFLRLEGTNEDILRNLTVMNIQNEKWQKGLKELREIVEILADRPNVKLDMMIVRGLDYYTGTVFETMLDAHPKIGSIGSGGRYDNLCDNYSSEKFEGVGASIGLSRMFGALSEIGLIEPSKGKLVDVLVIPVANEQMEAANKLAMGLRAEGKKVSVLYGEARFSKKMEQANRLGAKSVAIIGEHELGNGIYKLKDMETGEEETERLA